MRDGVIQRIEEVSESDRQEAFLRLEKQLNVLAHDL